LPILAPPHELSALVDWEESADELMWLPLNHDSDLSGVEGATDVELKGKSRTELCALRPSKGMLIGWWWGCLPHTTD